MTVAMRLREFLDLNQVDYNLVEHPYTNTARESAAESHVPAELVAKSVVVSDADGYVMAVIPANKRLDMALLSSALGRNLALAGETELKDLFYDCLSGAIPAVGEAFGFDVALDERLADHAHVYFEAGDHTDLVRVRGQDFDSIMGTAEKGDFCRSG